MTIEGRRKVFYGLRTETREIPPGEIVCLSHRGGITSFQVVDPDTIKKGIHVLHLGSLTTHISRRGQINAQKLRQADHLSIKDRLLGRGHEVYRWRP